MKVFISQPMSNRTDLEIMEERDEAIERIRATYGEDVEVMNNYFDPAPDGARQLWFLGKSFELLAISDIAYFIGDWKNYKGCRLEHMACQEYGIDFIEE